jgi:hypothetical protein
MKNTFSLLWALLVAGNIYAATPAPASAEVYFLSPANGATVTNPVSVKFGLKGMGVAPAGVERPDTGHHHLLIDDAELPGVGEPIPAGDRHLHFGGGQTETELNLSPGKHTLQLMLGDNNHIPHNPAVVSDKITVFVESMDLK